MIPFLDNATASPPIWVRASIIWKLRVHSRIKCDDSQRIRNWYDSRRCKCFSEHIADHWYTYFRRMPIKADGLAPYPSRKIHRLSACLTERKSVPSEFRQWDHYARTCTCTYKRTCWLFPTMTISFDHVSLGYRKQLPFFIQTSGKWEEERQSVAPRKRLAAEFALFFPRDLTRISHNRAYSYRTHTCTCAMTTDT